MSSRFLDIGAGLLLFTTAAEARDIRVCADPDNMPFSNAREEGFENRILDVVAKETGAAIVYVWGNERRATAIELMAKGRCDLVPGTIAGAAGVATTRPYMRSGYAFVTRGGTTVSGFDDPRLRELRIGVQSVGDDALTPPAEALLQRGLESSIRPFTLHGNAADPNTAGGIVHAVAAHAIDAAVLWGPFAGYFAARQESPLAVQLVDVTPKDPPMRFAVSMATRAEDTALRDEVDRALARRRDEIARILAAYHVPLLPPVSAEEAP
jgi:mxaJ protein